jgi:alpha-galactosidase
VLSFLLAPGKIFCKLSGMKSAITQTLVVFCAGAGFLAAGNFVSAQDSDTSSAPEIRTPPAPPAPHINGPDVFGVRPGHPFFYQIPVTGDQPMTIAVDNLPRGLKADDNGLITGVLHKGWFKSRYVVTFHAKNDAGEDSKKFTIVVGETIALTPPMGWNSWNAYHGTVTGDDVTHAARAMVSSGLIHYGWTYINIDDTWQGARGGEFGGIQPNQKFPDMPGMCDAIHGMGLKVGIYSTPWETSYAGYVGGSSDDTNGAWTHERSRVGEYCYADEDAKQWAAWGIDYLKYDWNPRNTKPTAETPKQFLKDSTTMHKALRKSGRDVVFSYSNSMPFDDIPDQSAVYNCWRTTGDIGDNWISMAERAFYFTPHKRGQTTLQGAPSDKWVPYARPGHWNDPDMMVLGMVNFGGKQHPSRLKPEEQYVHMTAWSMASAPLLLGCDLDKLDAFTLNLIENPEVLAIDQDSLGKQATLASNEGNELLVYQKDLEDGSKAVALYNLADRPVKVAATWQDLNLSGSHTVRDLWREKDLGTFDGQFAMSVASHSAELVKISP